ncbi:MAG TPA: exodeoxyribonuclease VII small subunit [Candidatus Nitrosotenuis sp.]|jgi:exodeoxyribonuclease VII small subunit|nr:exodeoxyribonuclease VII small subunit [Candidatus Nitrosotenuis sp.]
MTQQKQQEVQQLSFEEAMQELEQLVRRLEEGRLPLEEALSAYERGMHLKSHCDTKLRAAKLRVDQVIMGEGNEITFQPLEIDQK